MSTVPFAWAAWFALDSRAGVSLLRSPASCVCMFLLLLLLLVRTSHSIHMNKRRFTWSRTTGPRGSCWPNRRSMWESSCLWLRAKQTNRTSFVVIWSWQKITVVNVDAYVWVSLSRWGACRWACRASRRRGRSCRPSRATPLCDCLITCNTRLIIDDGEKTTTEINRTNESTHSSSASLDSLCSLAILARSPMSIGCILFDIVRALLSLSLSDNLLSF